MLDLEGVGSISAILLTQSTCFVDHFKTDLSRKGEREGESSAQLSCLKSAHGQEVMKDPVTLLSGMTYERAAIEEWIRDNNTDPRPARPTRPSSTPDGV